MRGVGLAGVAGLFGLGLAGAHAQTGATAPIVTTAETFNLEKLAEQGKALVEKARAGNGSAGMPLSQYPHSFTQLAVRTVDGGGELHKNFSDFLFVLDGEGTELTGGTMVGAKEGANGEVRGSKLEGAVAHSLHKGDMIHVPAGTNHQQLVAPGKFLIVYVIKVEEPSQ